MGVVETLTDAHKKMEDVAVKKAMLITKVITLADDLDLAGLSSLAISLDSAISKYADATPADFDDTQKETNIKYEEMMPDGSLDFDLSKNDSPADKYVPTYIEDAKTQQLHNQFVNAEKNKNIQKMLNKYLPSDEKIPLNGKLDDAFKGALSKLDIAPGSYKTWGALAHMIKDRGLAYAVTKAKQNTETPVGSGTQVVRKTVEDGSKEPFVAMTKMPGANLAKTVKPNE